MDRVVPPTTRRGSKMRMKFVQSTLASASSLLALSIALPASAQAQAADAGNPENLEEIVVTGLIGSLQRNLDMKREASGVVVQP